MAEKDIIRKSESGPVFGVVIALIVNIPAEPTPYAENCSSRQVINLNANLPAVLALLLVLLLMAIPAILAILAIFPVACGLIFPKCLGSL